MIRTEIIANRTVRDDILEQFRERDIGNRHTLINQVYGAGTSGQRHGDNTWPEENIIIILYTDNKEEAESYRQAVKSVKERFPLAGIKLYQYPVDAIEV